MLWRWWDLWWWNGVVVTGTTIMVVAGVTAVAVQWIGYGTKGGNGRGRKNSALA